MIAPLPRAWHGPVDGETVVFANSLGTTQRMWDAQVDRIAVDRRVLTFDLPGHTGPVDAPFGWVEVVAAVRDVLDSEDVRDATIVGVSLGGALGIALAAELPDRIARVVAVNTPIRSARDFWLQRADAVDRDGLAELAAGLRARWFPDWTPAAVAIVAEFAAMDPSGYAAACRALADLDVSEAAAAVASPTLVVSARDDQSVAPSNSDELVATVPGAVLWPVEDGGHLLPVTRPGLLNSLVDAFVVSHPTRIAAN